MTKFNFRTMGKKCAIIAAIAFGLTSAPILAQVAPIDPNDVYNSDLPPPIDGQSGSNSQNQDSTPSENGQTDQSENDAAQGTQNETNNAGPDFGDAPASTTNDPDQNFQNDDLIGAAEGVFGKGAEGLAKLIEDILKKQGQPNGYIVGREGSGAFIFGLRYGSGTLFHKVEGERPVYWTGPSIGFDAGANAGSTFILVYNLYDTEDLYKRFPAGEGTAYLVGGFNASYVRRGNIVLIPIRLGVGLRLGVNAGYLRFSKKQRWFPF